jgi:hypothetical protein
MYARITTYPTTALRDARERCEASTVGSLSGVTAQRGCRGALVLSDPMSGRVQTLSFWDSDDSLIASNRLHRSESRRIAGAAGLSGSGAVTQIFDVVDADVAMARSLTPGGCAPAPHAT